MDTIKPLQKNDFMIVKLIMTDELGTPLHKPFKLKNCQNILKCKALYNDGTEEFYNPYWTCPIILNKTGFEGSTFKRWTEVDMWGVFGQMKRDSVTVNAAPNHEKYSGLTCWVFPPKEDTPTGNAEIPHDGTGFDYEAIV
jgi:hypothetical protein